MKTAVIVTDPGTQQQFALLTEHIVAVMPAPREMMGDPHDASMRGPRCFIKTDVVEFSPAANQLVSSTFAVTELQSEILEMLGYDVPQSMRDAEKEREREFRKSPIAIPGLAMVSNFARKGAQ